MLSPREPFRLPRITRLVPTAVESAQRLLLPPLTVRKSTFAQRGIAVVSPAKPTGWKIMRLRTAPSTASIPPSSLVFTPKEVVIAKGGEPACIAGEPSSLGKVTSSSLRPGAARRGVAAAGCSGGHVAGPLEGSRGGGWVVGRRDPSLTRFPFAVRRRGRRFGQTAPDPGVIDVVEAVVGGDQARLGADKDVVACGIGVEQDRGRGALARGDQLDAASRCFAICGVRFRAGASSRRLPLIDVPGAVAVAGDERLVALEEEAAGVLGGWVEGDERHRRGGQTSRRAVLPRRSRPRRVAGDAGHLLLSRVVEGGL